MSGYKLHPKFRFFLDILRNIFPVIIAGLYHALVYTAQKVQMGLSWCLTLTYRELVIYRPVQNIAVTQQSPMLMVC